VYQTAKSVRYCWLIATPHPSCAAPPHQRSPYFATGVESAVPKDWRWIDFVPDTPLIV